MNYSVLQKICLRFDIREGISAKVSRLAILLIILQFSACQGFRWPAGAVGNTVSGSGITTPPVTIPPLPSPSPGPPWARTVSAGASNTQFNAIAVDGTGNVYVVGYQDSVGLYDYGGGVTATGSCPGCNNAVIIKYDSSGTALWARTVTHTGGSPTSQFTGVAVDSAGNVYAAGYQSDSVVTYDYGSGVTSIGAAAGTNAVLVKYDSNGNTQWALTPTGCGITQSVFKAVTVDSASNIYAVGYQSDANICNYGAVGVTGFTTFNNPILLKVSTAGTAIWGITNSTGGTGGQFYAVTTDFAGNIYAVGNHNDNSAYNYAGIVVSGASPGGNAMIVKFDGAGTGIWGSSPTAAANATYFQGVATDPAGNAYAAGFQFGNSTVTYGAAVNATGPAVGNNAVVVKYSAAGAPVWANSVVTGAGATQFNAVAVDSASNVFAVGTQVNGGVYDYGSGISVSGFYTLGNNASLIKYDTNGTPLSARSTLGGAGITQFSGVAVIPSGNIYTAGIQNSNFTYTYDTGVTATSPVVASNGQVVKYSP